MVLERLPAHVKTIVIRPLDLALQRHCLASLRPLKQRRSLAHALFEFHLQPGYRARFLLSRFEAVKVLHHMNRGGTAQFVFIVFFGAEQLFEVSLLLLHEVFKPFATIGANRLTRLRLHVPAQLIVFLENPRSLLLLLLRQKLQLRQWNRLNQRQ